MSWLDDFYKKNNIGGTGGVLDQEARDYWSGEAAKHGVDNIKNVIKGTAQAQGTWNKTTPAVTIKEVSGNTNTSNPFQITSVTPTVTETSTPEFGLFPPPFIEETLPTGPLSPDTTEQTDTTTTDTTNTSNNTTDNMSQLTDKEWLSKAYQDTFGRDASYGTKGGADYWLEQMAKNPTTHSRDEVLRMLQQSDEGKKFAASKTADNLGGTPLPGGIDPNKSISSQAGEGTWASHFTKGGVFENENAAAAIKDIAKDINFGVPKPVGQEDGINVTPNYFNTGVTDQTGADKTGTTIPPAVADGWWNQFENADAFKTFLQGDAKEETKADNGMGDFMKFMLLMNVMGGGRGGGGGYGGSQFGYGGMSPGGVQSAYDPMEQLKGMGTWFKDNFGSGSATTNNLNTP